MDPGELTPAERVAIITWRLCRGDKLTCAEVRQLTGLTQQGADLLLIRICHVCPVYRDDDHRWRRCEGSV